MKTAAGTVPVLAICGWSGSGKTTLIEALLPLLVGLGLRVAVLKHDVHGIDVDRPGKDSDRFFQAGADVVLSGPDQAIVRMHGDHVPDLPEIIEWLCSRYDLVLAEGHKGTALPKVWLLSDGETAPPPGVEGVIATLPRDRNRLEAVMALLYDYLPAVKAPAEEERRVRSGRRFPNGRSREEVPPGS